ncbi:MAG: hypothetical protein HZB84_09980 [Deltaproteobacteria bacterium]|nr:hypothetical protein [Deltaproteobacteria bacterium]
MDGLVGRINFGQPVVEKAMDGLFQHPVRLIYSSIKINKFLDLLKFSAASCGEFSSKEFIVCNSLAPPQSQAAGNPLAMLVEMAFMGVAPGRRHGRAGSCGVSVGTVASGA